MLQTILAVIVVTIFAALGMDPVLQLFTWLTQLGALGIVGLMAATSFSVIGFFSRNPGPAKVQWRRKSCRSSRGWQCWRFSW